MTKIRIPEKPLPYFNRFGYMAYLYGTIQEPAGVDEDGDIMIPVSEDSDEDTKKYQRYWYLHAEDVEFIEGSYEDLEVVHGA